MLRYGMVCYGMVWYGTVRYGMVWYGMVWYGMVWYGMVWYGMVWYGMVFNPLTSRVQDFSLSKTPLNPNGNHEKTMLAVRHNNHIMYKPNAAVYSSWTVIPDTTRCMTKRPTATAGRKQQ